MEHLIGCDVGPQGTKALLLSTAGGFVTHLLQSSAVRTLFNAEIAPVTTVNTRSAD